MKHLSYLFAHLFIHSFTHSLILGSQSLCPSSSTCISCGNSLLSHCEVSVELQGVWPSLIPWETEELLWPIIHFSDVVETRGRPWPEAQALPEVLVFPGLWCEDTKTWCKLTYLFLGRYSSALKTGYPNACFLSTMCQLLYWPFNSVPPLPASVLTYDPVTQFSQCGFHVAPCLTDTRHLHFGDRQVKQRWDCLKKRENVERV